MRMRHFWIALGTVFLLASVGFAQEQRVPRLQAFQLGRGGAGPLIPAESQEKLNLTADQKEKLAKIEKEFEEKNKDAQAKVREAIQNAGQNRDRTASQKIRDALQASQQLRRDYEGKVEAVLNDDQKKKFEEIKRDRPRPGLVQPRLVQPGLLRPAGQGAANRDNSVWSTDVQEKLNLTPEQKEKLTNLRKELEKKAQEVLTEEQKKKLEEIKKAAPEAPRRGGPAINGRPRVRPAGN